MLSCKQVVADADHLIAGEPTLHKKMAIWLHLIICVHCRRYLRQLRLLLRSLPHLKSRSTDEQVDAVWARIRASRTGTDSES